MYNSAGSWRDFFTRSGSHSTKGTRSGRTDLLPVKPEAIGWTGWGDPAQPDSALLDKQQARFRQAVALRRAVWAATKRIPVVHPEGREIPKTPSEVVAEMRMLRRQKGVIK